MDFLKRFLGAKIQTGATTMGHQVALAWTGSTGDISFNVYRSSTSGGPYQKLNSTPLATAGFVDTLVSAGQKFFYVVTGIDANNDESANSNEVSATIPGALAPTNLTASVS